MHACERTRAVPCCRQFSGLWIPLPLIVRGALQMSHTDEKKKQAQSYRKQLKDLEEQLARMRKDSHAKARLEALMRKSEDAMNRLKNDISRIRNQKSGLFKQVRQFSSAA